MSLTISCVPMPEQIVPILISGVPLSSDKCSRRVLRLHRCCCNGLKSVFVKARPMNPRAWRKDCQETQSHPEDKFVNVAKLHVKQIFSKIS